MTPSRRSGRNRAIMCRACPKHKFKAGFDYWITRNGYSAPTSSQPAASSSYGDEANLTAPLGGYAKVNLHTSYDLTEHVQIYGLIDNLFDARFGTFGNFFDTQAGSEASLGTIDFTNPEDNNRSVTPAIPFAAYGGVRVKF